MTHLTFVSKHIEGHTTRYFGVHGYKDAYLGYIAWNGAWRQYCFYPDDACVWSHDCLTELATFIRQLMEEWHNARNHQTP